MQPFQVVLHSHINMYKHPKTMIGIIIQTIHKVVAVAVVNKVQHLHHNKYNKIILIVIKVVMKQQ
jgi:hypothetical protein